MGLVSIVHVVLALFVIILVLIQDSKGGGVGGTFGGGSGSNSILGPTGAPSFLAKMTRYAVILFAVTSIILTNLSAKKEHSALDSIKPSATATPTPAAPQNPASTPAAPAAPTQPATK